MKIRRILGRNPKHMRVTYNIQNLCKTNSKRLIEQEKYMPKTARNIKGYLILVTELKYES